MMDSLSLTCKYRVLQETQDRLQLFFATFKHQTLVEYIIDNLKKILLHLYSPCLDSECDNTRKLILSYSSSIFGLYCKHITTDITTTGNIFRLNKNQTKILYNSRITPTVDYIGNKIV